MEQFLCICANILLGERRWKRSATIPSTKRALIDVIATRKSAVNVKEMLGSLRIVFKVSSSTLLWNVEAATNNAKSSCTIK